MNSIYLNGATMHEFQIGKFFITFLKSRYWCRTATFIRCGIDNSENETS